MVEIALFPPGDVTQEAGEDRAMDGLVSGIAFTEPDRFDVIEGVMELGVKVLPFAHAEIGEEIGLAELPPLALGTERLPLIVNGIPQIEQGEKIGLWVGEALVSGVRGISLVQRAFARVLNA